jgi:hypothetical protein
MLGGFPGVDRRGAGLGRLRDADGWPGQVARLSAEQRP